MRDHHFELAANRADLDRGGWSDFSAAAGAREHRAGPVDGEEELRRRAYVGRKRPRLRFRRFAERDRECDKLRVLQRVERDTKRCAFSQRLDSKLNKISRVT